MAKKTKVKATKKKGKAKAVKKGKVKSVKKEKAKSKKKPKERECFDHVCILQLDKDGVWQSLQDCDDTGADECECPLCKKYRGKKAADDSVYMMIANCEDPDETNPKKKHNPNLPPREFDLDNWIKNNFRRKRAIVRLTLPKKTRAKTKF